MTAHSTIRKVVRLLVVSLFAACVFAMWPLSSEAKDNNHVEHHDITVKKTVDKSSPTVATKEGTTKGNTTNGRGKHFKFKSNVNVDSDGSSSNVLGR